MSSWNTGVVVRGVVGAVQTFTGAAPQADDITALAARYLGAAAQEAGG